MMKFNNNTMNFYKNTMSTFKNMMNIGNNVLGLYNPTSHTRKPMPPTWTLNLNASTLKLNTTSTLNPKP
jgi:hypothetical protein